MTIEHAPSTNGRMSTNGAQPATDHEAVAEQRAGAMSRLVMPVLLVAVAFVVLRRLNRGHVV